MTANRLFAPDQALAEPMKRLELALRDAGRGHIALVTVEDAVLRAEAAAELAARLSGI